jgi:hypothetical protein
MRRIFLRLIACYLRLITVPESLPLVKQKSPYFKGFFEHAPPVCGGAAIIRRTRHYPDQREKMSNMLRKLRYAHAECTYPSSTSPERIIVRTSAGEKNRA